MNGLFKIDNIMYRVSDLKKAEEFYVNALGLKKIWEDNDEKMVGFAFEQNDSEIVIHANPEMSEFDYSYLVDDVVKFCEECKKKGYKSILEPVDVRSGKYAVLRDNDGNKIPIIDLAKFGGKPRYNMFQGFVLSESLKDPTILNGLEKIYVKVENHPEYKGEPKIWHDFKLKVEVKDIDKITELLSRQMKDAWYAHFWNDKNVYVVLPDKVFKIPREKKWQSKEYQELKEYALQHGVEGQYLEFLIED